MTAAAAPPPAPNGASTPSNNGSKHLLELNPQHALVAGLRTAHEANADDPALAGAAERRLIAG